ncbi:MAG: guanylate kinase [Clostridia bacterium]|nr:guanylate kinase [Clostridia bacterium]
MKKGLLIVLSGPSGAGKGTVYNAVTACCPMLKKSISVTTRKPRNGEQEGVHYYFRTVEEYRKMKANGEFLETAEVYKNFYGTPQAPVFRMLEEGNDVFFEIDIAGAKQIKQKYPECVSVFLMPPSFAVLEQRLRGRGTEDEESLATRIGSARSELAQYACFDYIVFNDDAQAATKQVIEIIAAERCKISRNEQTILKMLEK